MPLRSDPSLWFNLPGVVAAASLMSCDLFGMGWGSQGAFDGPTFTESFRERTHRYTKLRSPFADILGFAVELIKAASIAVSNWRCQSALNGPSGIQATENRIFVDAESGCPLSNRFGYAVVCNEVNVAKVGSGEGLFSGHPAVEPGAQALIWNASGTRPICNRLCDALVSNKMVTSGVVSLLCFGCPAAILWRIRTIVVDAFDGVLRRGAWPHVGIESGERITPTVAHDNAATTIMPIHSGARIIAAGLDAYPDVVLNSIRFTMRLVWPARQLPFTRQASAAFRMTFLQVFDADNNLVPAVAETTPVRSILFAGIGIANHEQAGKALPAVVRDPVVWKWGCINVCGHNAIIPVSAPTCQIGVSSCP